MILAVSSRAFIDACAVLGLDIDSMLREVGIAPETLRDPDGRLPIAAVRRLWAIAHAHSGDPDLALHAAESLPFGAYRAIDFLVANAPTIGAGLGKLAEYFRLINPSMRLTLDVRGDDAHFELRSRRPGVIGRAYAEYTLAACLLRTRIATRIEFPLRAVSFEHQAPPVLETHRRIFGCSLHFGQPVTAWRMDAARLEQPVAAANPDLFSVLDRHARHLSERVPTSPLLDDLRRVVEDQVRSGSPSLSGAAVSLAMSRRTLQRNLTAEGLTFREVLDEVRRDLAIASLEGSLLSIGEVGFLLGFATHASFCRAFKRWTTVTPKDWRRGIRSPIG